MKGVCKLCGKPKAAWQVFCGAACSVAWEDGIRTKEEYEKLLAQHEKLLAQHDADNDDDARFHEDE